MSRYFVTKPLVGHVIDDRKVVTISPGSLVQSTDSIGPVGLTTISWADKRVAVFVQDFIERVEPAPEPGLGWVF
jgi:hypothetical protein